MASRTLGSRRSCTKVLIDSRLAGGVAIIDKSRMPLKDMFSVLGIGVAVRVMTSTSARNARRRSFWRTPKRCSSSIMTRPKSLNAKSEPNTLWVPITISTLPLPQSSATCEFSLLLCRRLTDSILTGHCAKRSLNVSKCCWANSVVGTSMTTCLLLWVATNAARMATSVLPKPTSPHTSRSIAR